MRYATAPNGDPLATYRQIHAAGRVGAADPHALVALLYEEASAALRAAAWAAENRKLEVRSERVSRAVTLLFALESGLDFERGGDVSRTLATFYHGLRQQILKASIGTNPAPFRDAAASLDEIAGAWSSVRAAS
ncbi:flagellar export chaperone FliS [Sphingomonas canadensis]|uniref:Flagellar export chaperone FliS n=1 Tax=Sphingomonas canadensis TaxID=1219257 RepID=A0ABW3H1K4_9SPHN|nr:flagellar protein FliS [Sphingomonas canadensis]MCW3834812.1 flagellar protein FliS [Sphingomonas canadensis]